LSHAQASNQILANVRVLDFGRYVAGPYCATLLGYLGADVIRIEKIGGSEDRYIAPVTASGEGGVFLQTACNKRSICIDLGGAGAREVVARLVASADVVVANLPAALLQRLGLDYTSLCEIRPDIILASQSSFGDRGPDAGKGGFDGVGQALSGAMYISGTPGQPMKAAAPYVDYATATLAAFGTLAALMERERSGIGQEVSATLLGTALAVFNSHLIEQGVGAVDRVGTGNRVQTSSPSDVFETRDGHVLTHVVGNGLFRRWARLIGEEDKWTSDPRFATDQLRGDYRDVICERMAIWCAARTTDEAVAQLNSAGLPAAAILSPQQAIDNPQVTAMGLLQEVDFPGMVRPAPVAGLPLHFSRSPAGIRSAPPRLGEHSDEILRELGFDDDERIRLRQSGIIA
jgi:crotonobetainyl-CoA:carnitine CoA-transferase CaiB-like acyl-CoA transferase